MLGVACAAYDAPTHHGCPRRGGGYTRLSMTAIEEVVQIPFFQGMPAEALREIAAQSSVLTLEPGRILIAQHAAAEHLFFLMSGSVQIYIHFHGVDDLLVGTMREPGALLGWSVVRKPHRYTATVRCEEECRVLRLPREALMKLVETQPRLGYLLLKRIAATLANRLEQTRDLLVRPPVSGEPSSQ
jgi:CRP-like cAMP-binding protein